MSDRAARARLKLANRWITQRWPWRRKPQPPTVPRSELWPKVHDILAKQFEVLPSAITPQADFMRDMGLDSMDLLELTMVVEEAFGLEIPDEDAEQLRTMPELLAYLERRLARGGA